MLIIWASSRRTTSRYVHSAIQHRWVPQSTTLVILYLGLLRRIYVAAATLAAFQRSVKTAVASLISTERTTVRDPCSKLSMTQQRENMDTFTHVPPGFRFHPTDEELVDYYLRKKIASRRIDLDVIKDVDLYKIEPWDLQEICRIGTEEQNEWYFFSHKDKKYPTGTRTNRATAAGFWKATGRDKAIYSKHDLIGMRKTLVFYKGRAPNGQKSDWIMHEYRLETDENGTPQAIVSLHPRKVTIVFVLHVETSNFVCLKQEEGWVVCRVFKKRVTTMRKVSEHDSPCWYEDQVPFIPDMDSPKQTSQSNLIYQLPYPCKKELELPYQLPHDHFLQLPLLESPKLLQSASAITPNPMAPYLVDHVNHSTTLLPSLLIQEEQVMGQQINYQANYGNNNNSNEQAVDQVTDWRVLHKFVASQLSQDACKDNTYSNTSANIFHGTDNGNCNVQFRHLDKQEIVVPQENASTSNSSCPVALWK
ncbi:unnamed protein product [Sphenostylis stenocarpa]|uniref:NAC domain-containing protein n=1 Tax=Sphenostylis stenocarpa TaxID=92480 RepID=A0AA86S0I4_9FABA|nr:unnamed protein product [Sphenostylis stenocarpa]